MAKYMPKILLYQAYTEGFFYTYVIKLVKLLASLFAKYRLRFAL